MRMTMHADTRTIRAEPRRKILIVMSCVLVWFPSAQHQFNGNSLIIEFYPTRTSVFWMALTFFFWLCKHSRLLGVLLACTIEFCVLIERVMLFYKFNKHKLGNGLLCAEANECLPIVVSFPLYWWVAVSVEWHVDGNEAHGKLFYLEKTIKMFDNCDGIVTWFLSPLSELIIGDVE